MNGRGCQLLHADPWDPHPVKCFATPPHNTQLRLWCPESVHRAQPGRVFEHRDRRHSNAAAAKTSSTLRSKSSAMSSHPRTARGQQSLRSAPGAFDARWASLDARVERNTISRPPEVRLADVVELHERRVQANQALEDTSPRRARCRPSRHRCFAGAAVGGALAAVGACATAHRLTRGNALAAVVALPHPGTRYSRAAEGARLDPSRTRSPCRRDAGRYVATRERGCRHPRR